MISYILKGQGIRKKIKVNIHNYTLMIALLIVVVAVNIKWFKVLNSDVFCFAWHITYNGLKKPTVLIRLDGLVEILQNCSSSVEVSKLKF